MKDVTTAGIVSVWASHPLSKLCWSGGAPRPPLPCWIPGLKPTFAITWPIPLLLQKGSAKLNSGLGLPERGVLAHLWRDN